jgi:hypothetical protein
MSEILTVAVNAITSNPVDFLMGPMILPVLAIVAFVMGALAWKIAGLIEAKLNK